MNTYVESIGKVGGYIGMSRNEILGKWIRYGYLNE